MAVSGKTTSSTDTAQIDHIRITVYYYREPEITFVSPTVNNITYGSTSKDDRLNYIYVNATVEAAENIERCTLEWNYENRAVANYSMAMNTSDRPNVYCYANMTSLGIGNYSYRIFAVDKVGNANASATRHVYINRTTTNLSIGFVPPTTFFVDN